MSRLPPIRGEHIDRNAPIEFTFEGRRLRGFKGDSITSALLANGLSTLGRSFKYHRRRGLLSAAGHDVNVLMQLTQGRRSIPNVRADVTQLTSDANIAAVNTCGGLAHDRLAFLDRLAPLLPVGFYYKAFHGKRWFPRWERMFRRLAGLGEVDLTAARRQTHKRYDFCDVLVVGAGPSGLAAAVSAAQRGASVILVDENSYLGGSGTFARGASSQSVEQTGALIEAARADSRIRILTGAYAAGCYADNWVAVVAPECMIKVRARSVVIAQGAYEQPAVFRGNDLPNVMLAGAAQRLMYHYAVLSSRRVAVLTSNVHGYHAALDGHANGADIVAVLDLRAQPGPDSKRAAEDLRERGIHLELAVRPIEALGGRTGCVSQLAYASQASQRELIAIDGLWLSVGFAPANNLLRQANVEFAYERSVEQFVPVRLPPGLYACGKVNGRYSLPERIADGHATGARAAQELGFGSNAPAMSRQFPGECPTHPYPIFPHARGKEFVDFDEDLQLRDLENAFQEGFDSSELLKRFSTVGMGPSQGKHANMNALRILAHLRGEAIESSAMTTARPMFHPVPLAHLAGRGFAPERRTALDAEHQASGAVWMAVSNWRRPEYYAVGGKSRDEAIKDEVRAVRERVGIIDVSTLGKIEIRGPDSAAFLERLYTTRFSDLKVGMCRYGLMLDEAGIVVDDGVIGRLHPECFYFTTTTGNSVTSFREFARLATLWGMAVSLVSLTGHYAAFNLAGPHARDVLSEQTHVDLGDESFPHQGIREVQVNGVVCRIMRVAFVGEIGYEIHVPAGHASKVWHSLLASGLQYQLQPFGVEAQRMLRLEKGHIIVGQDTDGVTNALEIDAAWSIKMDKPFFIGQRSLRILEKLPRRQTLVGFTVGANTLPLPREGHLVLDGRDIAGRVTSVGASPTLGRCIGLALVTPSVSAGKQLRIKIDGGVEVLADICSRPFYDPKNERLRAMRAPGSMPSRRLQGLGIPARSPLHREFEERAQQRPAQSASLRLQDLSMRPRFGCKGPGAENWLSVSGLNIPLRPNSIRLTDNTLVARLGLGEFLVEALEEKPQQVDTRWASLQAALADSTLARAPHVYPVARQDMVMRVEGAATNDLLRQICSVNFERFFTAGLLDEVPLFLTSMAGVSVSAWPHGGEAGQGITLWIDPTFAHYFSTTVLGIAQSLGGSSVVNPPNTSSVIDMARRQYDTRAG